MKKHYLSKVFEPRSVAIVGASERASSVGAQVLRNMRESGFQGELFPVNPEHDQVQGLKAYASIRDIDHAVDLVVIAVPADIVQAPVEYLSGLAAAPGAETLIDESFIRGTEPARQYDPSWGRILTLPWRRP